MAKPPADERRRPPGAPKQPKKKKKLPSTKNKIRSLERLLSKVLAGSTRWDVLWHFETTPCLLFPV